MAGAHDGDRRVDLGQILVLRSVGGEDLIELEGRMAEQTLSLLKVRYSSSLRVLPFLSPKC